MRNTVLVILYIIVIVRVTFAKMWKGGGANSNVEVRCLALLPTPIAPNCIFNIATFGTEFFRSFSTAKNRSYCDFGSSGTSPGNLPAKKYQTWQNNRERSEWEWPECPDAKTLSISALAFWSAFSSRVQFTMRGKVEVTVALTLLPKLSTYLGTTFLDEL